MISSSDMIVTPTGVRFRGRIFPYVKGRGGITFNKHEGDGATPIGTHRVVQIYYRPDRIKKPNVQAFPIRPGYLWCDDPGHPAYNRLVHAPLGASHECMWRSDPLYDLVIVLDWNWPIAEPGSGSAIFIHQWRRAHFPTEGCVAFSRSDLLWLARYLDIGTRVMV